LITGAPLRTVLTTDGPRISIVATGPTSINPSLPLMFGLSGIFNHEKLDTKIAKPLSFEKSNQIIKELLKLKELF
jgi:hypothetical protein